MQIKTGDLREDSVGDMFTTKKATHAQKDGFIVVNEEELKEPALEKAAFDKIEQE